MTLDELPSLTVDILESDHAVGSFLESRWVGEGHVSCIVGEGGRFVWGRLVRVNREEGTLAFVPDHADELQHLHIGRPYPRLDGYWGERAELVLSDRCWKERRFEPVDAVEFAIEGGRMVGEARGELPAGASLVEGGWDHEHCEICWATISPAADPAGMFSEPNHWVCCTCHQQFIVPRSLGFVPGDE